MSKKADRLRLALLEAQRVLREQGRALVVLVVGVDGSGRHAVLNALTHHFDTRGVRVNAWSPEVAPGPDRPTLWRYWQALPTRSQVGLFLDGWYAEPIDAALRAEEVDLGPLLRLEAQLVADGAVLVKIWITRPAAKARQDIRKRLKREARDPTASEQRVLAAQDDADDRLTALREQSGDWITLDGTTTGVATNKALDALLNRLSDEPPKPRAKALRAVRGDRLATMDLDARIKKSEAKKALPPLQAELARRMWAANRRGQSVVMLLEGWDAAGKGGVIRRVTDPLDARLFQVIPIAAPSDEERARPYLWRFWRQLPRDGQMTIFDRSWYGRVLVERVEGFAHRDEWQRAYAEINDFEAQLVDHGVVLVKCWLHISPEEQLRRFQARADTPHKQHKLTEEDWRNREKWSDYLQATEDMLAHTDRSATPWTLVAADCKHHARNMVLNTLTDAVGTG